MASLGETHLGDDWCRCTCANGEHVPRPRDKRLAPLPPFLSSRSSSSSSFSKDRPFAQTLPRNFAQEMKPQPFPRRRSIATANEKGGGGGGGGGGGSGGIVPKVLTVGDLKKDTSQTDIKKESPFVNGPVVNKQTSNSNDKNAEAVKTKFSVGKRIQNGVDSVSKEKTKSEVIGDNKNGNKNSGNKVPENRGKSMVINNNNSKGSNEFAAVNGISEAGSPVLPVRRRGLIGEISFGWTNRKKSKRAAPLTDQKATLVDNCFQTPVESSETILKSENGVEIQSGTSLERLGGRLPNEGPGESLSNHRAAIVDDASVVNDAKGKEEEGEGRVRGRKDGESDVNQKDGYTDSSFRRGGDGCRSFDSAPVPLPRRNSMLRRYEWLESWLICLFVSPCFCDQLEYMV